MTKVEAGEENGTEQSPSTEFPTTLADLAYHLPSANSRPAQSFYNTLSALRKSTLSIPNRIISVLQDADFISALHDYLNEHCPLDAAIRPPDASPHAFPWPLIPNERSGSWPLDPHLKQISQSSYLLADPALDPVSHLPSNPSPRLPVSAYFKSTDGHISQWSFSTRRLNLPVLEMLGSASAAVLVDTTRRGKAYPDALRRTVPIWCSVWNHVLFPELVDTGICDFQSMELDVSEVSQIDERIQSFVRDLEALGLDLERLKGLLKKPIRCVWLVQPAEKWEWGSVFREAVGKVQEEKILHRKFGDVNIILCCSASRRVTGAEMSEGGYIQGAGDDSEGWSQGLTAKLFWDNKDSLLSAVTRGEELGDSVRQIAADAKARGDVSATHVIKPTSNVFLAANGGAFRDHNADDFDLIIDCNAASNGSSKRYLCLGCKDGKLGSKLLRDKLSLVKAKVGQTLGESTANKILVRCSTGKDLSVGVVLVILCCLYTDQGTVMSESRHDFDKPFVRQRLAWITSSKADANPARATLLAVNSFLMDRSN